MSDITCCGALSQYLPETKLTTAQWATLAFVVTGATLLVLGGLMFGHVGVYAAATLALTHNVTIIGSCCVGVPLIVNGIAHKFWFPLAVLHRSYTVPYPLQYLNNLTVTSEQDRQERQNAWEKGEEAIREYCAKKANKEELHHLAILSKHCTEKNDWDLSHHFSRDLQAVQAMSVDELLALSPYRFYQIIDAIPGEKAMEILDKVDAPFGRKMGLYFCNQNLAESFHQRHQIQFNEALTADASYNINAWKPWIQNKRNLIPADHFSELMKNKNYTELNRIRMSTSQTLKGKSYAVAHKGRDVQYQLAQECFDKWNAINEARLPKGIPDRIDVGYLVQLNEELRSTKTEGRVAGLRSAQNEVVSIKDHLYFSPGSGVQKEMAALVEWLNRQLADPQSNPLIVAASAYQRLVSIHPFADGNGRTARMLADLILRRSGLLPVAWDDKGISVALFPVGEAKDQSSPSDVLLKLFSGLEKSYKILGQ